jgi:lysophospholipase L1-like esterase
MRGTSVHRAIVGLALAACASLAMLLVLEVAVRVVLPQDLAFFDGSAIKRPSTRPGLRYELIPGGHTDDYVGVPVSVNRLGLRDRELAIPKPPGTVRILGLGDSVTFGYGVRLEETYLKVLERRLNTQGRAPVRYEVVNAGVEECGLDAYYHTLRALAPVLEPDHVLVGVVLNDIQRYDDLERQPSLTAGTVDAGLVRRLHGALLRRSQLYLVSVLGARALLYRLHVLDISDLYGSPLRALQPGNETLERAWTSSLDVLEHLVTYARTRDLPVTLVVFPVEVQLGPAALARYRKDYGVTVPVQALDGEPQRRLRAFGGAHHVPVVDLLPVLRSAGDGDLFLRRGPVRFDPIHPSVKGHEVIAEALHRQLFARPGNVTNTLDGVGAATRLTVADVTDRPPAFRSRTFKP